MASGPDEYAIERELEIRGINPSQVVFSYVDALYEEIDEDICDSGSEARCGTNQSPQWRAWVGFTPARLKYPILGFAFFLQFFTATFDGEREQLELAVNNLYPGT